MDIDYLIDRLEALIRNGKRVPLTGNKVMVDEQECYDMIDQMRVTVPEEVKISKRTFVDRERILADAEDESRQIVERAERERDSMLQREGLLAEAERQRDLLMSEAAQEAYELRAQAQQMYDEAIGQAQEMREGANLYAMQVLQEMENLLGKHLGMVQNGLKSFREQADQYQKQMDQYHEQYRPQYAAQTKPTARQAERPTERPAERLTERQVERSNEPALPKNGNGARQINTPGSYQAGNLNPPSRTQSPPPNQPNIAKKPAPTPPVAPPSKLQGHSLGGQPRPTLPGNSFSPASQRPALKPVPKPGQKGEPDEDEEL